MRLITLQGGCAPICRNTLMEVKDALRCCLNSLYYNLSENAVPKPLAYRLWNSCGVETPGICENLIRFVGVAGSTSTTQSPPKPSRAKSTIYNVIPVTVLWASMFTWIALVTLAPDIQN